MNKSNDNHKYDDIINLPHHTSPTRSRMAMIDRAAQFSPFAALTGYDAAVKETARLTEDRVELDEYQKSALNDRLQILQERLSNTPVISITYFVPDERKSGGAYCTETGIIKKIDYYERAVIMRSGTHISIDEIIGIEGDLFNQLDGKMI